MNTKPTLVFRAVNHTPFNQYIRVCLDCGQSVPYQYFGHDQKVDSCLDCCQLFLHANAPLPTLVQIFSQCWPTCGQAKGSTKILASQIFGGVILGTNQTHSISFSHCRPAIRILIGNSPIFLRLPFVVGRRKSYIVPYCLGLNWLEPAFLFLLRTTI